MSLEDASMVLQNLSEVLIIAYPLILIVLFLIARFIAGRSINRLVLLSRLLILLPKIIWSRIPLPQNRDELYVLSKTINNLLDRMKTQSKEKRIHVWCFTWIKDSVDDIKGTLEVLIGSREILQSTKKKLTFVFMK
jgi:hypothetical protein